MANSFYRNLLSPKIRFEKIKSLSSIKQLKDEEGFTLVELIVVVMMIGILSSIAIPQFMTAADKAKQKEATGIVSALVKAATAYQTEYGVLPVDAEELSEYAKFQECFAGEVASRGGAACKDEGSDGDSVIRAVPPDAKSFYTTSGNYLVTFTSEDEEDNDGNPLFVVLANPNGRPYRDNGSAVTGCYNPVAAVSEVYEYTAKQDDKGQKEYRKC
jgi:prepilin-type N-terminal cleavage/methylation domain-containing protein